jgi:hypothetical protein
VPKEEAEEAFLAAVCITAAVKAVEGLNSTEKLADANSGNPSGGSAGSAAEGLLNERSQAAVASQAVSHIVLKVGEGERERVQYE